GQEFAVRCDDKAGDIEAGKHSLAAHLLPCAERTSGCFHHISRAQEPLRVARSQLCRRERIGFLKLSKKRVATQRVKALPYALAYADGYRRDRRKPLRQHRKIQSRSTDENRQQFPLANLLESASRFVLIAAGGIAFANRHMAIETMRRAVHALA